MAWQDELIPMLRILINDVDVLPSFTDGRLEQTMVVAARLVVNEIDFTQTYTINISAITISPDPTATDTRDDAFANFVVLKSACFMDQSLLRTKALVAGIKAKCGPAVLETMGHLAGFKELITIGPCAAYKELKEQWVFGNAQVVKAILSPFVSNNFTPESLPGGLNHTGSERDRYFR